MTYVTYVYVVKARIEVYAPTQHEADEEIDMIEHSFIDGGAKIIQLLEVEPE